MEFNKDMAIGMAIGAAVVGAIWGGTAYFDKKEAAAPAPAPAPQAPTPQLPSAPQA